MSPPEMAHHLVPVHAFKFLKSKPSQMETLHECADPFRINLHVGSEYRESVPKLLQQMVKRAKYVLKRKPVNGRDLVIEFIVTKGIFTEPGINLICCRVSVRDAGYSPSVSFTDSMHRRSFAIMTRVFPLPGQDTRHTWPGCATASRCSLVSRIRTQPFHRTANVVGYLTALPRCFEMT